MSRPFQFPRLLRNCPRRRTLARTPSERADDHRDTSKRGRRRLKTCWNARGPRRASSPRTSEHAVSVGTLRGRDLFLQNVPMFRDLAVGHAENIDPDHGLRSPSNIAAMNHDIVAIGHHETGLVTEVGRQVLEYGLDRGRAVGDQRIMLPIVVAEQAIENRGIAIDKNAADAGKNQRLVMLGWI